MKLHQLNKLFIKINPSVMIIDKVASFSVGKNCSAIVFLEKKIIQ